MPSLSLDNKKMYLLVNNTKREVVVPREIGTEPGQRFHVGFDGSVADALYILTSSSWGGDDEWPKVNDVCGSWAGDSVAVISDEKPSEYATKRYGYKDISPEVREVFTALFGIEYEEITISGNVHIGWKRVDLT